MFSKCALQKNRIGYKMDEKWTFGGFDRSIPDSFSSPIDLNMSRGPEIPKKCPKMATKFLKSAPKFIEKDVKKYEKCTENVYVYVYVYV